MKIKRFDLEKDYPIVIEWWKKRNWPIIPQSILSKFGFIGYVNEKPIAAIWLYPLLGSQLAWIGFPIADPDSDNKDRDIILDKLIENIHQLARELGYKFLMTTTNIPAVQKRFEKFNYIKGDENVNHYWGRL